MSDFGTMHARLKRLAAMARRVQTRALTGAVTDTPAVRQALRAVRREVDTLRLCFIHE